MKLKSLVLVLVFVLALATVGFAQSNPVVSAGLVPAGIPAGLVINPAGALTSNGGPVLANPGSYPFNATACDSETPPVCSQDTLVTVVVLAGVTPPVINPNPLPATQGKPYPAFQMVTGGVPPYTISIH